MSNYEITLKRANLTTGHLFIHIPDGFKDEHEPNKKNLIKEFVKVIPFNTEDKPELQSIKKAKAMPLGSNLFVFTEIRTFMNEHLPGEDKELLKYLKEMGQNDFYFCVKIFTHFDVSTGSVNYAKHSYAFKHHVMKMNVEAFN